MQKFFTTLMIPRVMVLRTALATIHPNPLLFAPSIAMRLTSISSLVCFCLILHSQLRAAEPRQVFQRLKSYLDAVPAIDTHEHLPPFELIRGQVPTPDGTGMTLHSLWQNSYFTWLHKVTPWPASGKFEDWWPKAKLDFDHARATGFYRYQLPAFRDLYGVDFETISDEQAREVNAKIFQNYRSPRWVYEVVTEKANIEIMVNDPYWGRFQFTNGWPWEVQALNVTTLTRGTHPSEFANPWDSPYKFAASEGLEIRNLDDYLTVVDRLFLRAKAAGMICLKTTLAYERTLDFENVPKNIAEKAFGRPRAQLSETERKAFEDFIMWRLVEGSAKHDLPFQIHTGQARIQGSNPMLLVDLIAAHPRTKFILFHGGYPWIGETGAIMMRHGSHVWIDSVWLPTISYTMAKRAYQEWLEVMPSDRILWGADAHHAEGIYAATETTRRCLADALAEKVEKGELLEEHARSIASGILRENALKLFPSLRDKLWKHRGQKLRPPAQ